MVHISSVSSHESSLPLQQENFVNSEMEQKQLQEHLTAQLGNKLETLKLAVAVQPGYGEELEPQTKRQKKPDKLSQKEKTESHKELLIMNFDEIINIYGAEKGLDMIKKHFIQEINVLRKEKGLSALQENSLLTASTQAHVNFLANHANMYDFTGRTQNRNPHIQYGESGEKLNTPKQRALDLGYQFSLIKENISTVGFLRPRAKGSIQAVLQEWLGEPGHAENIFSSTKDIGVAYANGIVVMDVAQ